MYLNESGCGCLSIIFLSVEESCTLSDEINGVFGSKGTERAAAYVFVSFGWFSFFFIFPKKYDVYFLNVFPLTVWRSIGMVLIFSAFNVTKLIHFDRISCFFILSLSLAPFSFSIHFRRTLFSILFAFMPKILERFFFFYTPHRLSLVNSSFFPFLF